MATLIDWAVGSIQYEIATVLLICALLAILLLAGIAYHLTFHDR